MMARAAALDPRPITSCCARETQRIFGVPAFRLRGAYFAIGTLGLAEILRITVGNLLPQISAMRASELAK